MDFKTILTSVVVAAIITSIISWLSTVTKTNRESRLSRITDSRATWREKIREIAENLSEYDFDSPDNCCNENEIIRILTSLKVRINAYGYGQNNKPLSDSHIWNSIEKLYNKESRNNKEKDKLINYLSCLLKHDWERSKIEASANIQFIIGYGIYFVSNALLIYSSYTYFSGTKFKDVLLLILVFMVIFFSPNIMLKIYGIINSKRDWLDVVFSYIIAAVLLVGLVFVSKNDTSGLQSLIIPILLQLVALVFILSSKYKSHKADTDYIKEIDTINAQYESKKDE